MTSDGVRPASGEQFEISGGGYVAQIGQVAAVLRAVRCGDIALTESWPDEMIVPMGCGLVLVPWPNRVAGGRWTSPDGAAQQLDLTEPARGNASHGLLRNHPYDRGAMTADSVTLHAAIYPQHGYPFALDTAVTYAVSEQGLTVTHRIANVGANPAPFGVGAHPYLRVGDVPIGDLTVTVAASRRAEVDDALVPTGQAEVAGTSFDLRGGARVGDLDLDTPYTDIAVQKGRVEHRLAAPDGRSVLLWAEPVFGWTQVFTPRNFPVGGPRQAIAIEPTTCGPDAFNNGWGLLTLAPGEQWSASWGLRAEGF